MFKIILQIVLLIYIIFVIYNIINIQKYNVNGYVIDTDKYDILINNIIKLNPVKFTEIETNVTIDQLIDYNPECIINDNKRLKDYHSIDILKVDKNNDLFDQLDIQRFIHFDFDKLPSSEINIIKQNYVSIFKGEQKSSLKVALNNYNIIGMLKGETTIYLFNPKHKEDILGKENFEIKKWGHKKKLKENDIIFIPPYWEYIQESNTDVIQFNIDINNIFTFIPNYIRNI